VEQHAWGKFRLTSTGSTLVLHDPESAEWTANLDSSKFSPLLYNWYVVALFFRKAAVDGRQLSPTVRKSRFVGNSLDRRLSAWTRETRELARQLGRQRHWEIEARLDDLAAEIEYERSQGTFGFTGFGDYGVAECWTAIPKNPARRCDLYADSVLWAFNEFRIRCDQLLHKRTSLEHCLERLLGQVRVRSLERLFPQDVSAVVKRIQRLNGRVRKGRSSQLIESVLLQVTQEGPLGASGGLRTWEMWDRSRLVDLSILSKIGRKTKQTPPE
jgi:hypothetical protein